jgi:hypothetical protein
VSTRVLTLLAVVCAAIAGYACFPLLNATKPGLGDGAQTSISCNLSMEQVDRLAARLAPAVTRQLTAYEPKVVSSDMENSATDKVRAMSRATEIVDRMISNREVTPDGMLEAKGLLQQTGQADRAIELGARIARAVNRGDLTPEQAGILPAAP